MESSLTTARATWRDYYELCKPNVVWLMILTAIVGMCMATPGVGAYRYRDLCQYRHCPLRGHRPRRSTTWLTNMSMRSWREPLGDLW